MKKLILLRHAKSDWSGWSRSLHYVSDIERPLSKRGKAACENISKFFATRQLTFDLVEYSPAKRATDTFNLIKNGLNFSAHKKNSGLYTFDSKTLMNIISSKSDHINDFLLIGHNPAIEDLVGDLVSTQFESKDLEILRDKYPTGAIALLELNIFHWKDLQRECARLVEFVRPRDIEFSRYIR